MLTYGFKLACIYSFIVSLTLNKKTRKWRHHSQVLYESPFGKEYFIVVSKTMPPYQINYGKVNTFISTMQELFYFFSPIPPHVVARGLSLS